METNLTRVPRPFGITHLLHEYHKLEDGQKPEAIDKIRNIFLNQWFLGNGNICGKNYSINELSLFLKVDPTYVQAYMRDKVINNRLWDSNMQKEVIEGLIGHQLAWVLEDRMEVQSQVDILKASQGGKYTPFVSAELNKALKLKLETSTSLQSLFRTITGGGSTTNNFFTQINQNTAAEEKRGVSYEEAIEIIESSQRGLSVDEKRALPSKYIEDNYELNGLPVVCALEQEGVNTEKEGLNLNKTEMMQVTDNYKGAIEVADAEFEELGKEIEARYHHEHRRQLELGEDLDGDDPECTIYDEGI